MSPPENKPRLAHEQVLDGLKNAAESAFAGFAEPRVIVPVVVWRHAVDDLPAGLLAAPADEPLGISELLQCLHQLNRMSAFVHQQVDRLVLQQIRREQEGRRRAQQEVEARNAALEPAPAGDRTDR